MGKYYMKSTKEKIEFGDTITMEFTKEEEGKTVQKTLTTTFTPAIVDTLLKNGIIEKVSSQKSIIRQLEEDSFNAVFDNLDVINEKLKKQEKLLHTLLSKLSLMKRTFRQVLKIKHKQDGRS